MKFFGRSQRFMLCYGTSSKRLLSSKDLTSRPEYMSKLRECYRLEETQQIVVPQFKRALLYGSNVAVKDNNGEYTYFQLYMQSKKLSRQIANICGSCSCSTIGLFYSNDVLSVLCMWACWMAGQVVMPLAIGPQCKYEDLGDLLLSAKVKMIINSKTQQNESSSIANILGIAHIAIDHQFIKQQNFSFNLNREVFFADNLAFFEGLLQNNFYTTSAALSLYFKNDKENGKWEFVPVTHKQLDKRIRMLVQTWNVGPEDRILNIFSLQSITQFVENTLFALNMGSCLQLLQPYDPSNAWSAIMAINMPAKDRVNVVIADPKVYQDLIAEYDKVLCKNNCMIEYIKDYCINKIRLMIACSDQLSTDTYGRWLEITGHTLFENPSVYTADVLKRLQIEAKGNSGFDGTSNSLSSGAFNFRIVDSSSKILLECNSKSLRKLYSSSPTIVGTLLISSASTEGGSSAEIENSYRRTGDVVMYQDGVFTFVGRSSQE